MKITKLSPKQKQVLSFVHSDDYALICDGSVRSGKTLIMSVAFVLWAMANYNHTNFAICGKTVQSVERNVLRPLTEVEGLPLTMTYKRSQKILTVRCDDTENYFYLFGGRDESSYMLIQGITLAGTLFDEVALMPQSFVEQALARSVSYQKPKYFFNCNPESPSHYFYKSWIESAKPNTKHLHFSLEDNPIMSEEMIERTKAMYTGVFYDRYIRGLWIVAEGLIYPMYDNTVKTEDRAYTQYYITMDYGTLNPTAMLLWGKCGDTWYCVNEYYYSGRSTQVQKTDEEYYTELERLAGERPIHRVIIDPSAASFITLIDKKRKFKVWKADNDVINGIRDTATALSQRKLLFNDCCVNTIKEFGLYSWDEKSAEDRPIKDNDHAMDATRYLVNTVRILNDKKRTITGLI